MTPTQKAFIIASLIYLLLGLLVWTLFFNSITVPSTTSPLPLTLNMFASNPVQKNTPPSNQPTPDSQPSNLIQPTPQQPKKPTHKKQPAKPTPPKNTPPSHNKPNSLKTQTASKKTQPKQPKPSPPSKKPVKTPPPATKTHPKQTPLSTMAQTPTTTQPSSKPTPTYNKAIEQQYLQTLSQEIRQYAQQHYPYRARRRHQQGTVILSFTLHPDGKITHLQLHQSSGYSALDRAALTVIQQHMQAQFKPFPKEMPQQPKNIRVPIQYSLQ